MRVAPLLVLAVAACCAAAANAAPQYAYLQSWTIPPHQNAYDIVIGADGLAYVSGGFSSLKKFDTSGNALGTIGAGLGGGPTFAARDAAGNFYVSDPFNNRVVKFGPDGSLITTWGSLGSGNGQFRDAQGIAVDNAQNVYVSDGINNRVQKFDSNGNYLTQWATPDSPWEIAIGPVNQHVYLANYAAVRVYDGDGNLLSTWSSGGLGPFDFVVSIATDAQGNVYVSEGALGVIDVFDADGNFQGLIGTNGVDPGQFFFNFGMTFDAQGNLYVADRDNHRIDKFVPSEPTSAQSTSWGRLKSLYR